MDKQKLIKAYRCVEDDLIHLWYSQTELSQIASSYYGKNIKAEICGDGEIEFRLIDKDKISDSNSTIRLEDILKKQ